MGRASRLAKRLHRKHKQLMRVLIRKQRTKPRFVEFWKKAAKRAYALSKADEPIRMSKSDKGQVEALKKKIYELFKKHQKLHSMKMDLRTKIRKVREVINGKKQAKKDAKKDLKAKTKLPVHNKDDVKTVKDAKKVANKTKFKLKIARLNRKAIKEHRHNLREQDRAVINAIKQMQSQIFKLSGQHFKRPSIARGIDAVQLKERQNRMANKIKRAQKGLAASVKLLNKARTMKD